MLLRRTLPVVKEKEKKTVQTTRKMSVKRDIHQLFLIPLMYLQLITRYGYNIHVMCFFNFSFISIFIFFLGFFFTSWKSGWYSKVKSSLRTRQKKEGGFISNQTPKESYKTWEIRLWLVYQIFVFMIGWFTTLCCLSAFIFQLSPIDCDDNRLQITSQLRWIYYQPHLQRFLLWRFSLR